MKKTKTDNINNIHAWTLFEILFLSICLAVVVGCFVFSSDRNYFSLTTSLIGVVAVLTVSKGLVWAPYVNVVFNTCYAILAFTQGFYGEFIISVVLMNAIYIMSIVSWVRNKGKQNDKVVQINKISKMEYTVLVIATLVVTVLFYFILKALNTRELVVGTLSLVGSGVAAYLMFRRCSNYALGYIFNDIVLILMWSLNIVTNGWGYLPTVISFVVFLLNDIYGFIHWKKEEKSQIDFDNNIDTK